MQELCRLFVMSVAASLASCAISPKWAERSIAGGVNITCDALVAVDKCIFKVWLEAPDGQYDTQTMDLSKGLAAPPFNRKNSRNDHLFDAAYLGGGLDKGHCGVRLWELTEGRYFVGCRVRVLGGGWTYDFMALAVSPAGPRESTADVAEFTNHTVELNGNSSAITFHGGTTWQLFLPEQGPVVVNSDKPSATAAAYTARLQDKGLAVTLYSVKKRSSGLVWAQYKTDGGGWQTVPPQVVNVRGSPKPAEWTVPVTDLAVGSALTATCSVADGRPAPRLRWTLDGDVVREDAVDDTHDAGTPIRWAWPWDVQFVRQEIKVKVTSAGTKTLRCLVFHPDFNATPQENEANINVSSLARRQTPTGSTVTSTPGDRVTEGGIPDVADDAGEAWPWVLLGIVVAAAVGLLGFFGYRNKDRIQDEVHRIRGRGDSQPKPVKTEDTD